MVCFFVFLGQSAQKRCCVLLGHVASAAELLWRISCGTVEGRGNRAALTRWRAHPNTCLHTNTGMHTHRSCDDVQTRSVRNKKKITKESLASGGGHIFRMMSSYFSDVTAKICSFICLRVRVFSFIYRLRAHSSILCPCFSLIYELYTEAVIATLLLDDNDLSALFTFTIRPPKSVVVLTNSEFSYLYE